jgi:hypothetical protein
MKPPSTAIAGILGLALSAGCLSCPDDRNISYSADLTPGDLAYFHAKIRSAPRESSTPALQAQTNAGAAGKGEAGTTSPTAPTEVRPSETTAADRSVAFPPCSAGFPALFLPVLFRQSDGHADFVEGDGHYLHLEDLWAFCLLLVRTDWTANFDPQGRNLAWWRSHSLLFGIIRTGIGAESPPEERFALPTSNFELLWGLLGIERTSRDSHWTVLWIPID